MKKTAFISLTILLLAFSSCIQELSFKEAQPTEKKNETKFKNKFRGEYLCIEDSSILIISKNKITQNWNIETKLTKTQIDTTSELEFKDGLVYIENNEVPLNIDYLGDTAIISYKYEETIFNISDNQLLRYFKGIYFLNYKQFENSWNVKTLSFNKAGILSINKIHVSEEEIKKIKDLTNIEETTDDKGAIIDYTVHPTKKELKEILKSNLFKEGKTFIKIKK